MRNTCYRSKHKFYVVYRTIFFIEHTRGNIYWISQKTILKSDKTVSFMTVKFYFLTAPNPQPIVART